MVSLSLLSNGRAGRRRLALALMICSAAVACPGVTTLLRLNPGPAKPPGGGRSGPSQSIAPKAGAPLAAGPNDFGEPLPGFAVISPFGLRQLPWERRPRLHAGVDIVAPMGTAVRAVLKGRVVRIGLDRGYGRFVQLRHAGNATSVYAHLGGVAHGLRIGSETAAGAILGEVGSTGASTGAHLHFELRDKAGRPLDPSMFLGRAFKRTQDWPLRQAALISAQVRIAHVSSIPERYRELVIAQEEAGAGDLLSQLSETGDAEGDWRSAQEQPPSFEISKAEVSLVALEDPPRVPLQKAEELPELLDLAPPPARPRTPPRLAMPD